MSIEPLESRIAPAAVFRFTDVDGDKVTITSSKGGDFDLMNATQIVGGQLQTLDLSGAVFGAEFNEAAISIIAVRGPGGTGDGKVNVGYLKVIGEDLGAVTIDGDLGRIDVGDGNASAPALASLTVGSMYRLGLSTQDGNADFHSTIKGRVGALRITGDMLGSLEVQGGADGRIGPIFIGGSLLADPAIAKSHGFITTDGNIGAVTVKGSFFGGGPNSLGGAVITSGGKIARLTVGGSIFGQFTGGGESGGVRAAGDIGRVKVAHDVQGTTLSGSNDGGFIRSDNGKIGRIFIGGSLIGGTDTFGGAIFGKTGLGDVKIVGELRDGTVVSGATLGRVSVGGSLTGHATGSGLIRSAQAMGAVKIGGDIVGGVFDAGRVDGGTVARVTVRGSVLGGSGNFTGWISAENHLGPVKVRGDLIGGTSPNSGDIVSGSIDRVTIGGSIYAGGATFSGRIVAGGGDIGPVKIAGDLRASYVEESALIFASGNIASVTIGGSISTTGLAGAGSSAMLSGSVRSGGTIDSIVIHGSVLAQRFGPAVFSAKDKIGSLRVDGTLEYGQILAGFDTGLAPVNADAQIGKVKVGGDWIATSLSAGIADSTNDGFGQNDTLIPGGSATIEARLARLIIRGGVTGSEAILDFFGITAEAIGKTTIHGVTLALTPGKDDLSLDPTHADFHLREI